MSIIKVELPIDPDAVVQMLTGPEGLSIILVKTRIGYVSMVNNCPDENLPLNELGSEPALLNGRHELVCAHHFARFDSCSGCTLAYGRAHHAQRLAAGLLSVRVLSAERATVSLELTPEVLSYWRRAQTIRHRKTFGRGPVGYIRYTLTTTLARLLTQF